MRARTAVVGIRTDPIIHRDAALSRGPATLFVVAVLLLYVVSGGMLWLAGYNYEGLTGSAVTKIHPGSYVVFLTFFWVAVQSGNPINLFADMARTRPACFLLLVSAIIVFLNIVARKGPGMAGILDSYLLPPFVVMLFVRANTSTRDWIERVIHLAMFANAILGLVELGTHHLYFPFRFDGEVFAQDTRSTALQGHPLGNATITAFYVMSLLAGGGTLSMSRRVAVIVLQLMAMVAFGGRVALVTTVIFAILTAVTMAHRSLRSGRIPILGVAAATVALIFIPLVLIGLSVGGFFDAILVRFATDGGSANARVEMIHLMGEIPLRDLIVGPDAAFVDSIRRVDGLELGIENPIVRLVVYQGILITGLLMIAVGLFLYELARWSRPGMVIPILGFLIIINTFESLASKSVLLAKFAIMMLVLYRWPEPSVSTDTLAIKRARFAPAPLVRPVVRNRRMR